MYRNLNQVASYPVRLLLAIFEAARERSSWLDPNCAGQEKCLTYQECQDLSGKTTREILLSFADKALKKQGEETLNLSSLSVDIVHLTVLSSVGFCMKFGRRFKGPNCYSFHLKDEKGEYIDEVIRALFKIWPEDPHQNEWFGQIRLRAAGIYCLREKGFPEEVLRELCTAGAWEETIPYSGFEIVNKFGDLVFAVLNDNADRNLEIDSLSVNGKRYVVIPTCEAGPDYVWHNPLNFQGIVDRFCCYENGVPNSDPTIFHFHKLIGDKDLAREILKEAIEIFQGRFG